MKTHGVTVGRRFLFTSTRGPGIVEVLVQYIWEAGRKVSSADDKRVRFRTCM